MSLFRFRGGGKAIHSSSTVFLADRRGSNAVEFAMIAPVLMFLVTGIICAALYLAMMNSLAQVAADAARYAMIGLDPAERLSLAKAWVANEEHRYVLLDPKGLTVATAEKGPALIVTVGYDASSLPLMPLLVSILNVASVIELSTTVLLP